MKPSPLLLLLLLLLLLPSSHTLMFVPRKPSELFYIYFGRSPGSHFIVIINIIFIFLACQSHNVLAGVMHQKVQEFVRILFQAI